MLHSIQKQGRYWYPLKASEVPIISDLMDQNKQCMIASLFLNLRCGIKSVRRITTKVECVNKDDDIYKDDAVIGVCQHDVFTGKGNSHGGTKPQTFKI